MYLNAKKMKNYAKSVLKGCDFFENFVIAFIVALIVYVVDKFNLVKTLSGGNLLFNGVIISTLSIGIMLLITVAIYDLKGKNITLTDSFIEIGAFGFILSIVYVILAKSGFLALKIALILVLLVFILVLAIIRSNYFEKIKEKSGDEIVSNSNLKTYFKTFFNRHWVTVLVAGIVGILATVWFDEADIYMKIHLNENAFEFLILTIALLLLAVIVLVKNRIEIKRCNLVDAMAFILLFADLTLFVEASIAHVNSQKIAFVIAIIGLLLTFILFALLAYNTNLDIVCDEEKHKETKPSFALYFKKVFDNHHLGVVFAICAFAIAIISFLESTNILASLMSMAEIKEYVIIALLLGIAFLVFFIISYELPSRKVVLIDTLLLSLFIIFLVCSIVTIIAQKTLLDLKVLLFFAPMLVSLAFIVVRILRVREFAIESEEIVVPSVEAECACTNEEPEIKKSVGVRKSYELHLRTADDEVKKAYEILRNALETYKIKSRITKSCENFSRTGITPSKVKEGKPIRLQVKFKISGKFIKAYMNLNPENLKEYRIKDVSNKYPDQPTYIKVRSKLSIKRALELIDMLAVQEGFVKANDKKGLKVEEVITKLKEKHAYNKYAEIYNDSELTIMQKLGYEHIVQKYYVQNENVVYLSDVNSFHKDFAEKLVISKLIKDPHRYIYDEVSLETIEKAFDNGAIVNLESMRNAGIVKKNANFITVKASEKLTKNLIVEANVIEPNAVAMIFIAGGSATRIVGE